MARSLFRGVFYFDRHQVRHKPSAGLVPGRDDPRDTVCAQGFAADRIRDDDLIAASWMPTEPGRSMDTIYPAVYIDVKLDRGRRPAPVAMEGSWCWIAPVGDIRYAFLMARPTLRLDFGPGGACRRHSRCDA